MLSVALRPKYLGLLALMVAATVICGLLAGWQWNRANEARDVKVATETTTPVPLDQLMSVSDPVTNEIQGRLVTITGRFEENEQALATDRVIDGAPASILITNFHIEEGPLAGASIPIARGALPTNETAPEKPSATTLPSDIPPAPAETLTLVVRLEAAEGATGEFPRTGEDGTLFIDTISSTYLVNTWGGPMLSAYGALTEPAHTATLDAGGPTLLTGDLKPLPAAESHFSAGLNLQNFGYMLQWILFGVFFLYIWWRSVRTQYLDEQQERRLPTEPSSETSSQET